MGPVFRSSRPPRASKPSNNNYVCLIGWCLRFRGLVVLAAVVVFLSSLGLLRFIKVTFMSQADVGYFMVNLKADPGSLLRP